MSRRPTDPQSQKRGAKQPVQALPVEQAASRHAGKTRKQSSEQSRMEQLSHALTAAVQSNHFQCDSSFAESTPAPAVCELPADSIAPKPNTNVNTQPASRNQVSTTAIEAACEILSESKIEKPAVRPASSERPASPEKVSAVAVLRDDLQTLGKTLREEFCNAITELQNAQAAAIASQSEVLRTLTEMIYQTSGSQDISADSLERAFSGIEERLLEKIGTLATSGNTASDREHSSTGSQAASSPSGNGIKLKNAASAVNQSWQQIRDEMFNKEDFGDSRGSSELGSAERLPDVAQLTSDRHFRLPEQDPSLEIPKAVDAESLSDQELREALRARETFISTLIARIRRQQDQATGQLSPEQLRTLVKDLPEELAVQVRHTLKQMEELARMGELELSLERARIARQVNQLEHSRMLIERNARQLGLQLNPDGSLNTPSTQPGRTKSSSRRWLGKLGFGQ